MTTLSDDQPRLVAHDVLAYPETGWAARIDLSESLTTANLGYPS